MANTIKAKRDENGNAIVKLFGSEFDVTALLKNGYATAVFFGEEYEIELAGAKKVKTKKLSIKDLDIEPTVDELKAIEAEQKDTELGDYI